MSRFCEDATPWGAERPRDIASNGIGAFEPSSGANVRRSATCCASCTACGPTRGSGCTTAKAGDLSDVLSPFEPAGDTPHAVAANATTATMANLVVLDTAGSLFPPGPVNETCAPRVAE